MECEPLNLDGDGQADVTVHGGAARPFMLPRLTNTTIGERVPGVESTIGVCSEKISRLRDFGGRQQLGQKAGGIPQFMSLHRRTFDDTGR